MDQCGKQWVEAITQLKKEDLKALIEQCNTKDHADVELSVYESLKKLI